MDREEIKQTLKVLWDDALNGKDFELCSIAIITLLDVLINKK